MWAGRSSWNGRLLHVGVRSDLYYRPHKRGVATGLLIDRAKRVMAKSRAQSRCGYPVFYSSIHAVGNASAGNDEIDQRRVSPNAVSPSYLVKLRSFRGAASVSDPSDEVAVLVVQVKSGVFRAFSAIFPHAGFRVQFDQNYLHLCPCHRSIFNGSTGTVPQNPQSMAENRMGLRESVESGYRPSITGSIADSTKSALGRAQHRRRDGTPNAGAMPPRVPPARLGQ